MDKTRPKSIRRPPLARRCRLDRNNLYLPAILSTNDRQLYRVSDGPLGKKPVNVIHGRNVPSIYTHNHIALSNAAGEGGTPRRHGHDLDPRVDIQPVEPHQTTRKRTLPSIYSQMPASYSPHRQQLRHYPFGGIGRNGETDPLSHSYDGGIYPDEPPPGIDQRSA